MKKILIVEDEKSLLSSLKEKFLNEGFDVLDADNGADGLNLAIENKPDFILLDIVMPKMEGIEMLKKLRSDEWGLKTPVLILSNLSDMDKISEAKQYNIVDYVIKTEAKLKDIVDKVNKFLNNAN